MAVASFLLAGACAPPASLPAPPPEARRLTEPGAHDQRLDDVIQEIRDGLPPRRERLDIDAYRLPAQATWPSVIAHYQPALSGWDSEPALPEQIRAARARAWKRPGAAFAIALIDTPVAGERSDYKILVIARTSASKP